MEMILLKKKKIEYARLRNIMCILEVKGLWRELIYLLGNHKVQLRIWWK